MGAMAPTNRHHPSLASLLALSTRQHGLVTRAQLLDAGPSAESIKHRVRTGRIHIIHRSVYAIGHPRLTREGRWLAAVLACGEGAALSYLSAATLWGIWERAEPPRPQVSVPSDNGRRGPRGIELHRTALGQADVTVRDAVPVTTLRRTLLDLATVVSAERLKSALRQSERLHRLDLRALRASLDAFPRCSAKPARLKRTLDAYVPGAANTEADVEMAFLELCASHGLPMPETQVPIGRYRAAFATAP